MMIPALLLACTHTQTSWEALPAARVEFPTTTVAVVAGDASCAGVADALVHELRERPELTVSPTGTPRLVLRDCALDLTANVEVEYSYNDNSSFERREVTLVGLGKASLVVERNGTEGTVLGAHAARRSRSTSQDEQDRSLRGGLAMQNELARELAQGLAQQISPLPEVVVRRYYRAPEPGSAEDLHNRAVDAERQGDLDQAIEYAAQALAQEPRAATRAYLDELQQLANQDHDG